MPGSDASTENAIAALAAEMAEHSTHREAPVRAVMALLGDRWTTLILLVLATGEWRHAELRRVLVRLSADIEKPISQRVLTLKLRTLERDGFVDRSVTGDVPPRVSYRLTPMGQALFVQARKMIDWVRSVSAEIESARAHFDRT